MATARFSSAFVTPRTFVTQPLRLFASVSGIVYESEDADAPQVRLFTKEGCTLCDKVKVHSGTILVELYKRNSKTFAVLLDRMY